MSIFNDKVELEMATVTRRYEGDIQDAINAENYELAAALKKLNEIPDEVITPRVRQKQENTFLGVSDVKFHPAKVKYTPSPDEDFDGITIPGCLIDFLKKNEIFDYFLLLWKNSPNGISRFENQSKSDFILGAFPWGDRSEYWESVHDEWCNFLRENNLDQ